MNYNSKILLCPPTSVENSLVNLYSFCFLFCEDFPWSLISEAISWRRSKEGANSPGDSATLATHFLLVQV